MTTTGAPDPLPAPTVDPAIRAAEAAFEQAWPKALTAFSPFTRLAPPVLCRSAADAAREELEGSFAMIRLRDDRIVIGLPEIVARGLTAHAHAILAHEVGHYVHAPGTLREHVRLHDRIRRTLGTELAAHAGLVANLYTDLLLNDRLQRSGAADIAAVYLALRGSADSELWSLYLRSYEWLWLLPRGTLGAAPPPAIDADAELVARVIRSFRADWLEGAASFTLLVAPYLAGLPTERPGVGPWMDTAATSIGDRVPDGLTDDDFDPAGVPHPAVDARLTDDDGADEQPGDGGSATGGGRAIRGDGRPDRRAVRRGPKEWLDTLRAVGVRRSPRELVARYYRELAMPHVIPFPGVPVPRAADPLPEGLDTWDAGGPLETLDWIASLARSPIVIPGVTTVERVYGTSDGGEPERRPPDLYLGIDCSGSMGNPAHSLAYPVVAGAVLALSALRAGARVMVCLSGEWHGDGSFVETPGFGRDEAAILGVLTDYLGTGCSFGLPRLAATFANAPPRTRPVHVVVVSDSDLFSEIDGTVDGWAIAARSVAAAGAGATAVLNLASATYYEAQLAQLRAAGFTPYLVASQAELVDFARAFARRTFGRKL